MVNDYDMGHREYNPLPPPLGLPSCPPSWTLSMCREMQDRLVGLERRVAATEVAVAIPEISRGEAGGGGGGAAAAGGGVTVGEAVQTHGQVFYLEIKIL